MSRQHKNTQQQHPQVKKTPPPAKPQPVSVISNAEEIKDILKENAISLQKKLLPSPGKTLVNGLIFSLICNLTAWIFTNTLDANHIHPVLTAPKGVKASERQGHYIFSGSGLTAYGEMSNSLSDAMANKLGSSFEGYGYYKAGGSYINALQVQSPENELSVGFMQSDTLPFMRRHGESKTADGVKILMQTQEYEAVFMLTNTDRFKSLTDLQNAALLAEKKPGLTPVIATASHYTSGSYYTAKNIAECLGGKIKVTDYATPSIAMDTVMDGNADICLFVEYPGPIKDEAMGSLKSLFDKKQSQKGSHLSLLNVGLSDYNRIKGLSNYYSDADVNIPNFGRRNVLATRIVIVGPDPDHIQDPATRNSAGYFQQFFKSQITPNDVKLSSKENIKIVHDIPQ